MTERWSETARQAMAAIGARHGFGAEATVAMAAAIVAGNGRMAQFGHAELGGMGQWSRGGMLMIGDMFNNGLKARVGSLAQDLAAALADGSLVAEERLEPVAPPRGADEDTGGSRPAVPGSTLRSPFAARLASSWWPRHLGSPAASGAQNGRRYAVFPDSRRLAVERDGRVRLYDTGDHRIGGVSQAQGGGETLRFASQHGSVDLADLSEVKDATPETSVPAPTPRAAAAVPAASLRPTPAARLATAADFATATAPASPDAASPAAAAGHDIIDTIRRLAELRDAGALSEPEFAAKKAELLARL